MKREKVFSFDLVRCRFTW